jgi:hypothetical protein
MVRLVRSGTDGAQLGLEGAHQGMVAVSPTPRADGDPNPPFGRLDGESNVAKHEAAALKASEVTTTLRIINVEEHCTSVRLVGVPDQVRHSPLVQVDGIFPFGGKDNFLDLCQSDGNWFTIGIIG